MYQKGKLNKSADVWFHFSKLDCLVSFYQSRHKLLLTSEIFNFQYISNFLIQFFQYTKTADIAKKKYLIFLFPKWPIDIQILHCICGEVRQFSRSESLVSNCIKTAALCKRPTIDPDSSGSFDLRPLPPSLRYRASYPK